MEAFTAMFNQLMSVAVFGSIITSITLAGALLFPETKFGASVIQFTHKYILAIGFFISFAALVCSLIYSDVIGYAPCIFCWYARIAYYPQVIMFAIAIFKKDRKIVDYSLGLTVFGLLVTGYHTYTNMVGYSPLPCGATVSCLTRYVYEYGFITIPLMGLVGFITLFLALLASKKHSKISAI